MLTGMCFEILGTVESFEFCSWVSIIRGAGSDLPATRSREMKREVKIAEF